MCAIPRAFHNACAAVAPDALLAKAREMVKGGAHRLFSPHALTALFKGERAPCVSINHVNPPRVPGKDDVTGEPLTQRPDDSEQTVQKRIAGYHTLTQPLVDYYRNPATSGGQRPARYVAISGSGPVESIRDRIFSALEAGG